jgi:Flp pilus assembly pilin Flp
MATAYFAGLRMLLLDRRGTTSLEYGLLACVLFVSILFGINGLAHKMQVHFDGVSSQIERGSGPGQPSAAGSLTAIIIPGDG